MNFIPPAPFHFLSHKMKERLKNLRFVGWISLQEGQEKQMRLVTARSEGICLYWLVDEVDGVIADAKFQVFGSTLLMIVAEIASELVLRKNYDQVSRFSTNLFDSYFKECSCDVHREIEEVLLALHHGVHQCLDLPFKASYESTPIAREFPEVEGGIEGWELFSETEKLQMIEEVIQKEVQPYIELDAGGVKVEELKRGVEVHITYEGSCTSCYAATGSTLSAIQQILRARLHPSLEVIPKL